MATISSHVLDSVTGTHAAGIKIACFHRDASGKATRLFDLAADNQGRIQESIDITNCGDADEYELVFQSADYYRGFNLPDDGSQIMSSVVLRLKLPDAQGTYHFPVMLSPHSYSVWWSGSPPHASG